MAQSDNIYNTYFIISRVVSINTDDGETLRQHQTYSGSCNLSDFNMTFGRYGVPPGWTVTAIVMNAQEVYRSDKQSLPDHVQHLLCLPKITDADWWSDFRQCFRLDKDFNPLNPSDANSTNSTNSADETGKKKERLTLRKVAERWERKVTKAKSDYLDYLHHAKYEHAEALELFRQGTERCPAYGKVFIQGYDSQRLLVDIIAHNDVDVAFTIGEGADSRIVAQMKEGCNSADFTSLSTEIMLGMSQHG